MDKLLAGLEAIPKGDNLPDALHSLTDAWQAQSVGLEGVEAILHFIETYPDLDYGAPGALVHFAEGFYRSGYEAKLLRSFARKPTVLTAWMVHRILNGTQDADDRKIYAAVLRQAVADPTIDEQTRAEIEHYL